MFAEERYLRIMELVNRDGKATVAELSDALGVSPVTVRRDLEKLEEKELLVRTHGGAMALHSRVSEVAHEKSFSEKEEALVAEKERIAEAAAKLVNDEDAVLLTAGTTNMMLAKKLAGKKGLKVVTNAANIAVQIGNYADFEVILIGGKLRPKSYALVGPLAESTLASIRVDKLFLGVDGFDLREGLTTPNLSEANMDRNMISIAKEVIVVADHSKFGRVFFSHVAPLSVVHKVVTNRELDARTCDRIRDLGIQLIVT
ncbi:DeoR/GlpR family DNA-binding transcription regulator [Paenibacillus ginsengarvi]|nr:DeoR/GlpR family DNA-binding transcription regulator [Paenibacillus ginsengarvi]